jgi:hypothetical protein
MLQLITKLPEGKDPAICICFKDLLQAQKTNQDLRLHHSDEQYSVKFMPAGKLMSLMLISGTQQRLYLNMEYDYNKFLWWMKHTKGLTGYSFCHVYQEFDRIQLVNTQLEQKRFYLKVSYYTISKAADLEMPY